MPYYALFGKVEIRGVARLEPLGGFDGEATAYFFTLTCDECGEETAKEVCLYPDQVPCRYHLDTYKAFQECYPKCACSGHVVRKCKLCGTLGSLSLVPGYGKSLEATGEKGLLMVIKTSGYVPIDFRMECNWIVARDGAKVYGDDDKRIDHGVDDKRIDLNKIKFSVSKVKKSDLP